MGLKFTIPGGWLQCAVQRQGCRWTKMPWGTPPSCSWALLEKFNALSVKCSWRPESLLCEGSMYGLRYAGRIRNSFPCCKLGEGDFLCNIWVLLYNKKLITLNEVRPSATREWNVKYNHALYLQDSKQLATFLQFSPQLTLVCSHFTALPQTSFLCQVNKGAISSINFKRF